MTIQNLASIFGPTLLGSEGTAIEAQIRVTETIITYALDMFELGTTIFIPWLTFSKKTNKHTGIFLTFVTFCFGIL